MCAMELRAIFAVNLKAARKSCGLSQEALADLADLDRSYVSLLENQRYSVSLDTIERLAKVLETEPAALLQRSGEDE